MTELQGPDAIDAACAPARRVDAYAVVLDGEAVILDERLDRLHLLNHTATLLWQLFDGTATLADLAADLAAELDVDRDVDRDAVLADLVEITRHLGEQGLLDGIDRREDLAGA